MLDKLTRAQEQKARRLKTTYKQTLSEHNDLRASQGNKCAVCDRPFGTGAGEYLAFQDFEGKIIRGLLCFVCLRASEALRLMERKGTPLERAVAYRRKWDTNVN